MGIQLSSIKQGTKEIGKNVKQCYSSASYFFFFENSYFSIKVGQEEIFFSKNDKTKYALQNQLYIYKEFYGTIFSSIDTSG